MTPEQQLSSELLFSKPRAIGSGTGPRPVDRGCRFCDANSAAESVEQPRQTTPAPSENSSNLGITGARLEREVERPRDGVVSIGLGIALELVGAIVLVALVLGALFLLGGCATELPAAPVVHVYAWPGQELADTDLDASRAWEAVGFEVEASTLDDVANDTSGLGRCPRGWHQTGDVDCLIAIGIRRSPHALELCGGATACALRDERGIILDSAITDRFDALSAVAHEVGHVVLDTSEHTVGGVMGGATYVLDDVDYELACREVHLCVER